MKKKQIFWASVCLLLSCASARLNVDYEDDEDYPDYLDTTVSNLPSLRLVHRFCAYKEETGPCRAFLRNYFFNSSTQQCEEFIYGGCGGNKNRFETLEECKKTCVVDYEKALKALVDANDDRTQPDPVPTEPLTPRPTTTARGLGFYGPSWCLTPADRGLCKAHEKRFYYNSSVGKCLTFNYSGCGGNENNFVSEKSCLRACKKGITKKASGQRLIRIKTRRKHSMAIAYHYN